MRNSPLPPSLAEHRDGLLRLCERLAPEHLERLLDDGLLDEQYQAISAGRRWLVDLQRPLGSPGVLEEDVRTLSAAEQGILRFYRAYFESHTTLGDPEGAEDPQLLFLLGNSDRVILEPRTRSAAGLLRKHPRATAVLCGGGFGPSRTEAAEMAAILEREGIPEKRLVLEEDSIETIGNALFGKLLLLERELLPERASLALVTSAFHGPRSLTIFRRVFGPSHRIAVFAVDTLDDVEEELRCAAHELSSDARSSREIFGLTDPLLGTTTPVNAGDHVSLLLLLLLHHDLYRHRYDLRRRYARMIDGK